ncbi:7-cyano-7-deazaguanine synthase [Dehalobacter sp.]
MIVITFQQSMAKYELIAPFAEQPRQKVIKEAYKLQVPITWTFSCNAIGSNHCLLCRSCYEREEALKLYEKLSQEESS